MAKFRADPASSKVDLGVGVYRDLSGNTPVLASVRRAEQAVLAAQTTKSYVAPAGREEFNRAGEEMVLAPDHLAPPPAGPPQRSDMGKSHAPGGQFGPAARTLPLLRSGNAPATLRRHARAARSLGGRGRGLDSCLLPQSHRRRSRSTAMAGAGSTARAQASGAISRPCVPGLRRRPGGR